jgi:hypothetical protein
MEKEPRSSVDKKKTRGLDENSPELDDAPLLNAFVDPTASLGSAANEVAGESMATLEVRMRLATEDQKEIQLAAEDQKEMTKVETSSHRQTDVNCRRSTLLEVPPQASTAKATTVRFHASQVSQVSSTPAVTPAASSRTRTSTTKVPDFLDFDRLWNQDEVKFCGERDARKFAVACTVYSIANIHDVQQSFRAKYRLLCNVAITQSDFVRHMTMKDPAKWKPAFIPHLQPVNASWEIKRELLPGPIGELYSVQVAFNGEDKSWVAHYEIDCETEFIVPFDVRFCPFDVQQLKMIFHIEDTRQSFSRPRHWVQWHWEAPWTAGRFAITSMPQGDYALDRKWIYIERVKESTKYERQPDQFHICILAQRNWQFFFWRVMFVLFIINGVTCSSFLFKGYDERMNCVSTMLVAIVTFLFVTKDMVPHVAYFTLLDYYVYGSFTFICCVAVQIATVKACVDEKRIEEETGIIVQNTMGAFNCSVLLAVNSLWGFVSLKAWLREQSRFDALFQEEHKIARKNSWTKGMTQFEASKSLGSKGSAGRAKSYISRLISINVSKSKL